MRSTGPGDPADGRRHLDPLPVAVASASDPLPTVPIGWVDGTAAAAMRAPRLGILALLPLRCQDRLLRLALGWPRHGRTAVDASRSAG